MRKKKDGYGQICRAIYDAYDNNETDVLSQYELLSNICAKYDIGLAYNADINKLYVYGLNGLSIMQTTKRIFQNAQQEQVLSKNTLPHALFAEVGNCDGTSLIIDGQDAILLTENCNWTLIAKNRIKRCLFSKRIDINNVFSIMIIILSVITIIISVCR